MRRLIPFLLALLMVSSVYAAEIYPMFMMPRVEVRVSQPAAVPGEEFYVDLYLAYNPGLILMDFTMNYDPRVEVMQIGIQGDFADYFGLNLIPTPFPNPLPIGMMVEDFANIRNVYAVGTFARVNFRVRDDATVGHDENAHFELDFTLGANIFADENFSEFIPVLEDGYIRIYETFGHVPPTGIANITWAMYAMFALVALAAGLWILSLRKRV